MDKLSDEKRCVAEFLQLNCPCFHGGSCNRVGKVIVKDEEELPKGISKVEMEIFRILDLSDKTKRSQGYEFLPYFVDLFLCPTLRNLVDSLKIGIPSSLAKPIPVPIPSYFFPTDRYGRPPGTYEGKQSFTPKSLDMELGMSPEDMEKYISYWCAQTVIADYNNKHATNYKLVEAINGRGFVDLSMCYHCIFTAIDTNISSSCELYFAEIQRLKHGVYDVVATRILDDTQVTYDCCSYCISMKIPHPVNGFKQGIFYYMRPPQPPEYSQRLKLKHTA